MPSMNLTTAPETQVLTIPSSPRPAPLYPFLSHPPQKKRPTQPLPPLPLQTATNPVRPRSATISAISSWAAKVHPGSPAPWSPRRSPSISLTGRRSSFSRRISGGSARILSASFASFTDRMTAGREFAVTPSINDFPADLTAMGYTSVFIHFPQTPTSPPKNHHLSTSLLGAPRAVSANSAKQSKRGLKHLKSLSSLKSGKRARSKAPPSPRAGPKSDEIISHTSQPTAVTKSKKSKYAKALPTPLANELALAQLMDGGKLDDHVKRYCKSVYNDLENSNPMCLQLHNHRHCLIEHLLS